MNFQPTDYLNNLNIEMDPIVLPESNSTDDLNLFTSLEFFDLDVFSHDFIAPSKQQQLQVKREAAEPVALLPEESHDLSEIKRKRNTEASARFRIKKKLKEKQMQQQARELQERLQMLEKKLKTLETENKCLKQLILEKNEKKSVDLLDSIKKRLLNDSYTYTC